MMERMKLLKFEEIDFADRFIAAAELFVGKILGDQIMNVGEVDLMRIVEKENQTQNHLYF